MMIALKNVCTKRLFRANLFVWHLTIIKQQRHILLWLNWMFSRWNRILDSVIISNYNQLLKIKILQNWWTTSVDKYLNVAKEYRVKHRRKLISPPSIEIYVLKSSWYHPKAPKVNPSKGETYDPVIGHWEASASGSVEYSLLLFFRYNRFKFHIITSSQFFLI